MTRPMMKARVFTPENRLAKIVAGADAPTREQLLQEAEARLEQMAPPIQAEVRRCVGKIAAAAAQDDDAIRAGAQDLTRSALEITNIAVSADLAAIGEVARGFAVLMDCCVREGVWRRDVFLLHVDALKLVESQRGEPRTYQTMIADLHRLRAAIGVRE
jgi:hypothetical protein